MCRDECRGERPTPMLCRMPVPRIRLLAALAVLCWLCSGPVLRAEAQAQPFPSPNPPPGAPAPNAPPAAPAAVPVQPYTPPPAVRAEVVPYQPPAPYQPQPAAPPPVMRAVPIAAPEPPPVTRAQPVAAPEPQPPSEAQPVASPEAPPPAATAPPPAAAAPTQQERDVESAPEGKDKDKDAVSCLIGEFCIGPVLSAGGLNVFGIGAHARMDYWGIGFDYQFIGLTYSRVDGTLRLMTLEGRIYPGGGAFYFAGGVAWQHANLESEVTIPPMNGLPQITANAKGSVTIPMLKLGVGFMGRDHLVLGIDIGVLIRLESVDVQFETDLPRIAQVLAAEAQFRKAAKAWIEWFPFTIQFNVLRLGFLF